MRKVILSLLFLFAILPGFILAQEVKGKVTDEQSGTPLPGASVYFDKTSIGAATDMDGNYLIPKVPAGTYTIVVNYVGYESVRRPITFKEGETKIVDFSLKPSTITVSPVVVTAIGTKAEREKLGTAVSTVQGPSLVLSGARDLATSISVKAPGVNITESTGDPGAATRIVLRGARSLNNDNQPLFVLDGVPITNELIGSSEGGTASFTTLNDLNPSDIQNIDIYKGPAASALWGSRAANGVVVITTKSGAFTPTKKVNIQVKSSAYADDLLRPFPLQTSFGQGFGGSFGFNSSFSWGDRIADRSGGADVLSRPTYPYSRITNKNSKNVYDHATELFRTPISFENEITASGGDEWGSFYLGLGRLVQNGIIKANSDFTRTSVRANVVKRFADNLTARVNTNYVNSSSGRIQQGSNISGILLGVYRTPPDFNNDPYIVTYVAPNGATYLDQQRTYRDGEGSVTRGPGYNNPLWSINNALTTYNTNRLFGTAEILYDPNKWANITYRAGVDYSALRMNSTNPVGDASYPTGSLARQALTQFQFNTDLIGTAQLEINDDFNGNALVGFHLDHRQTDNTFVRAQQFSLLGVPPTFSNAQQYFPDEYKIIIRTAALYGQINFNMYNQLYLSLSGRNESTSTYGPNVAQTYFYPSASAAWEFTKLPGLADNSILNYGKVRAAVGTAANQPPVYASGNYFNYGEFANSWGPLINPRYYGGGAARSTVAGNKNLGPERTTEIEFGTELRFLQDRVTLSATQYFSKTTGAALQTDVAPSSGYTSIWQNAANISNIGTEIQLTSEWLRLGNFSWTTTVNWFTNKNKVTDLPPGLESVFLSGFTETSSRAILNQPVGVIYGSRWERDANGNLVLDANNFPIMATTPGVIGNPNPKWRAGFINTFRYERFTLNVIFDFKQGGSVWNGTKGALSYFGTSGDQQWWTTLTADQASKLKNYWGLTPAEVINEGYKTYTKNADGSYSFRGYVKDFGKGPVLVDEMYFWDGPGSGFTGPAEQFVEDGSYVRLKEVSLSYTLPLQFFGFQSVTFTAIGRNLKLWTDYTGVDPETNLTGPTNGQGLDYFNNPSARTFVFSVQINY